jgi:hypothetical protein
MPDTIVTRYAFKTGNTRLPRTPRDPNMTAGTLARFDFTDAWSNPNPDGAVPLASTFRNMVEGGPNITVAGSGTAFSNKAGKTGLVVGTVGSTVLNIGAPGALDMKAAGEAAFLVSHWFALPASGETTTSFWLLEGNPPSTGNTKQWSVDMGTGGKRPRFQIGYGSATTNLQPGADIVPGTLYHMALFYDPGAVTQTFWLNGVQVSNAVGGFNPAALQSGAAAQSAIWSAGKATHLCWSFENVTLARAANANFTPAAWIANEYRAENITRFGTALAA